MAGVISFGTNTLDKENLTIDLPSNFQVPPLNSFTTVKWFNRMDNTHPNKMAQLPQTIKPLRNINFTPILEIWKKNQCNIDIPETPYYLNIQCPYKVGGFVNQCSQYAYCQCILFRSLIITRMLVLLIITKYTLSITIYFITFTTCFLIFNNTKLIEGFHDIIVVMLLFHLWQQNILQ